MSHDRDHEIQRSWSENAEAWMSAVREGRIESRRMATDAVILLALRERAPARVLDLGCGEGWLCRALAELGIATVGIDASAALIEAARAGGGGEFHVLGYGAFAREPERFGRFDAVACNFALLDETIAPLLAALREALTANGALLIQTVHPWTACDEEDYRDGWRVETFADFGTGFGTPMPWYFRTLESWLALLQASGWRLEALREPAHPQTGRPVSLLLVAVPLSD